MARLTEEGWMERAERWLQRDREPDLSKFDRSIAIDEVTEHCGMGRSGAD